MFEKAFALGKRVSPYFAGTVPVRWSVLHYPEAARDQYVTRPDQAWENVLYPFYGAYLTLLRAHLPVGIITDSQLKEGLLDGYGVLFLPAPASLTPKMQVAVKAFMDRGGKVVKQRASWQWHKPGVGHEKAAKAFLGEIKSKAPNPPVQAFGGPEKMHSVSFINEKKRRITIALTNDFSWINTGGGSKRVGGKSTLIKLRKDPQPCTNVKLIVQGYGKPARVFEAVKETKLSIKHQHQGIEIPVPDFSHMAVVVLEY
jgi:hypothetical protein